MTVDPVPFGASVLASILRPRSGSNKTSGRLSGLPNPVHIPPTSWLAPVWVFFLVALAAFPAAVSAAPPTLRPGVNTSIDGLHRRGQNDSQSSSGSSSSGSISMSVWLPILVVTVVFVFFSFFTCVRRCTVKNAAASTTANRAAPTNGNTTSTTRPRRRPQRTPSQISTKSLPPYMKEPGDQELVLFRGPAETEDDHAPHHAMPMLAEDDEEHHEMRNGTFDIALDRIESVDTMADSSTANLIRRVSVSVPRPPELHHATMPHGHRRSGDAHSLDSVGSEAELLAGHQRVISVDNHPDPRGEAPSYTEAVEGRVMTISLNDPDTNNTSSNPVVPPSHTADVAGGRTHSRFSFLMHNPFSSHNNASNASSNANPPPPSIRSGSPTLHTGSTLSRFSSRESHESHHPRAPSRNNNLSRTHTRSNSNLFRAFRSHSPGLHAGSSTISLDSISAPLTHTVTRAEFHAPKGGLLSPEQIKLITSREALERFGMPYGPDAVAAFSLSREMLAEMGPPPEFESVTGEQEEQASATGNRNGATEAVVETTAQTSGASESDTAPPRSTSLSPSPQPSLSHRPDVRAESRASTDMSYATAHESDGEDHPQAQIVQVYASDDESGTDEADELRTARPMIPGTAVTLSLPGSDGLL